MAGALRQPLFHAAVDQLLDAYSCSNAWTRERVSVEKPRSPRLGYGTCYGGMHMIKPCDGVEFHKHPPLTSLSPDAHASPVLSLAKSDFWY
jgi:hypothetical protein